MDSKDFEDIYYKCQNNPNLPDVKLGKFSAKNYRSLGVSATAHSVKSDNPDLLKKHIAINKIANHIINQNILTPKDTIIPAPQHTGRAEYTLEIAKIISEKTGCKIADVLGCVPRDTLYNLKKRHGSGSIADSGIYLLNNKFPKYNVWFLDNVAATGKTFNDARKLIPHIKPLIYSISPRLKVKMKNRKPYFIRENNEDKIKALTSKIEEYRELCGNVWVPQAWKVAYSKVPEGLKLTIDTDEWFDEENPLGHLIDFILDIYDSDYNSSVKELTGINVYSDVDFLSGEKSGYATYLIKNNSSDNLKESRTYFGDEIKDIVDWLIESPYNNWQEKDREYLMNCDNDKLNKFENDTFDLECAERSLYESNNYRDKNMKLEEGPSPKWKQKILDDENEIFEIVYPIVNDKNGEWKEPEKYLSFSVNKFIAFIKKFVDAKKYSENLLKDVAIDLWIDLHCDFSVGDFNELEVQRKYVKYYNLGKELWNALCDEYQAKYGRKRKSQPYIKDPTDASEIFDKMSALKYESKKITQKRIEESFERVLNKTRI